MGYRHREADLNEAEAQTLRVGVLSGGVGMGIVSGHKEVPVTHLRRIMLEELERRNYSQSTVRAYVKTIEDLARYFKRPPNQLGPNQLRQY